MTIEDRAAALAALRQQCNRCSYTWVPRQAELPVLCPACRSSFWNRPRTLPIAPEKMAVQRERSPQKEKVAAKRAAARAARAAGAGNAKPGGNTGRSGKGGGPVRKDSAGSAKRNTKKGPAAR